MGPQIVWKILSDGNWVMMPNGCEKLSDEWWVISYEWWVMEIEWWKNLGQTAPKLVQYPEIATFESLNHI